MKKSTLHISILGTSFSIQSDEDSEYLTRLLKYYESVVQNIQQTTPLKEPIKTAVLAGIMLTDELFKAQLSKDSTKENYTKTELAELENRTLKMIDSINQILK